MNRPLPRTTADDWLSVAALVVILFVLVIL